MKKSILLSLLIGMMGVIALGSCTKYNECSCENIFEGYLYVIQNEVFDSYSGQTVKSSAFLSEVPITELNIVQNIYHDHRIRYIYGSIPQKIKELDGRKVKCCISQKKKSRPRIIEGTGVPVYTIKCIEEK